MMSDVAIGYKFLQAGEAVVLFASSVQILDADPKELKQ